jgi:heme-degrading monooxygenase HmoA
MIFELVEMNLKPGMESAFESAFEPALELLRRSTGCAAAQLLRCIEHPSRFRVLVQWQTLEHHTEQFRGSADHTRFKEIVAPFVERSSGAEHHTVVMETFANV